MVQVVHAGVPSSVASFEDVFPFPATVPWEGEGRRRRAEKAVAAILANVVLAFGDISGGCFLLPLGMDGGVHSRFAMEGSSHRCVLWDLRA